MGLGAKREIYSGYEPSWIFAHTAPYWIQELQDEKILPTAKELLMNGGVDENFCYVSEEEISDLFTWLVPQAMSHHNMNAVIDTAKEFRCFEDFDYRNSRQKIDHYRKWYHSRVKNITVESLDELKERYAESNDGMDWDVHDERSDMNRTVLEPVAVNEFLAPVREKQVLSHPNCLCVIQMSVANTMWYLHTHPCVKYWIHFLFRKFPNYLNLIFIINIYPIYDFIYPVYIKLSI